MTKMFGFAAWTVLASTASWAQTITTFAGNGLAFLAAMAALLPRP